MGIRREFRGLVSVLEPLALAEMIVYARSLICRLGLESGVGLVRVPTAAFGMEI